MTTQIATAKASNTSRASKASLILNAREYASRIKGRLFGSMAERILKAEKKLPARFHIQLLRSLHLRGVADAEIEWLIQDTQDFTMKNYGPTFDPVRIVSFIESVLLSNGIEGDMAECGVYQGSSAKLIRHFSRPEKRLHLFDTFSGFTKEDREAETHKGLERDPGAGHTNTSMELAKTRMFSAIPGRKAMFKPDSVVFHVGKVQDTLEKVKSTSFSLVHLDMDLYAPTKFALEYFIPRMTSGGVILLHDFAVNDDGYRGVYQATQELGMKDTIGPLPFGDHATAVYIKK